MADLTRNLTIAQATGLYRAGKFAQAEAMCLKLIKRDKRNIDVLQLLGTLALKKHDYDEARKYYKKCLSLKPKEAHFHYLLGKVDAMEGRFDRAVARFDESLRLKENYAFAASWKAATLERDGQYDKARATLAPFIEAGAEDADMAEVQAKIESHDGEHLKATEIAAKHLASDQTAKHSRIALALISGKAFEKLKDYDKAFASYQHANQTVGAAFDPDAYVQFVDRVIKTFSRSMIGQLPRASNTSETPIFIAGMPRSGTTLVEQILDAHPQAQGMGEITDMEEIVSTLPVSLDSYEPYPECIGDLTESHADALGARYLAATSRYAPHQPRAVNKSLHNYRQLGVIQSLLPKARIVHCRRDPRDTCLSIYFSNMLPAKHAYACDLSNLGVVYRQYERLMAHWVDVLDLPILEVVYEELVEDLENQTRRLIEFCSLPWDESCLQFHQTGRSVMTLSYDQVRRPIYRTSMGRWRSFKAHLSPLLALLEVPESGPAGE